MKHRGPEVMIFIGMGNDDCFKARSLRATSSAGFLAWIVRSWLSTQDASLFP
jgi:hypothetical protein